MADIAADAASVQDRLGAIRLLAMDVDGVLTDGGIVMTGDEPETKRFHVLDGLGIQLATYAGIVVAWISGRDSTTVERRARELGVQHVYQNTPNKSVALGELLGRYTLTPAN